MNNKIQSIEQYNHIKSVVIQFLKDVSSKKTIKKSGDLKIILTRFMNDGCFKSKRDYNFAMRFYLVDRKHYVQGLEPLIKDLSRFRDQMDQGHRVSTLEQFLT